LPKIHKIFLEKKTILSIAVGKLLGIIEKNKDKKGFSP